MVLDAALTVLLTSCGNYLGKLPNFFVLWSLYLCIWYNTCPIFLIVILWELSSHIISWSIGSYKILYTYVFIISIVIIINNISNSIICHHKKQKWVRENQNGYNWKRKSKELAPIQTMIYKKLVCKLLFLADVFRAICYDIGSVLRKKK